MSLPLVLGAIIALFFVFLAIRNFTDWKICAICGAVVATWTALIIANLLGYEFDILILGILMGQSVTGAMYLADKSKNIYIQATKPLIIIVGTALVYGVVKWLG
ncbi:MAG TPA: hypothetical protein VJ110_01735 [Candidatus Nanoarchaeia archaeon]|nr:hypothetical protein [Candidatus Nanoarchaeia archaeon]